MTGLIEHSNTNIATVKLFSHSRREANYAREGMSHFLGTVYPQMRLATLLNSGVWAINALLIFSTAALSIWLWHGDNIRSEEHTSELQSRGHLVCRLLLEKKKRKAR